MGCVDWAVLFPGAQGHYFDPGSPGSDWVLDSPGFYSLECDTGSKITALEPDGVTDLIQQFLGAIPVHELTLHFEKAGILLYNMDASEGVEVS